MIDAVELADNIIASEEEPEYLDAGEHRLDCATTMASFSNE